ncbi:MAG: hypothetical protein KDE56_08305 [Anaerolineales bacterium]|nr:hypothetical protein [Anaerolineales bacterium]
MKTQLKKAVVTLGIMASLVVSIGSASALENHPAPLVSQLDVKYEQFEKFVPVFQEETAVFSIYIELDKPGGPGCENC